ncbi:MAG TPA: hypothetical protein IAB12_00910 [Candidatus Ornithospirochaeta avicola]|uniref:Uncharacterized protein n=1 Tax=Candidatus Ornithospirochaeta avicola TaxID=2840896 RepID=A0A9D1TM54_9SPIO|nr:hypothetical protein [Candidatus Ornithospirochaeta avicola]
MKKVLLAILLAALSVFTLSAASTASFDIKAYKLRDSSKLKVEITDAIPGGLDTFTSSENGKEIDLSSVRQNLLGQTDIEIADFAEHVIFSWRVWGNTAGTYTVKINFSTFNLQKEENGTLKDEGEHFIGVRFESGNETFTFPDYNDSVVKDENENELGRIELATIDNVAELKSYVSSTSTAQDGLSIVWTVDGDHNIRWIAHGAVAANISTSDFENEYNPNGIYRAYCTVSLESRL